MEALCVVTKVVPGTRHIEASCGLHRLLNRLSRVKLQPSKISIGNITPVCFN